MNLVILSGSSGDRMLARAVMRMMSAPQIVILEDSPETIRRLTLEDAARELQALNTELQALRCANTNYASYDDATGVTTVKRVFTAYPSLLRPALPCPHVRRPESHPRKKRDYG